MWWCLCIAAERNSLLELLPFVTMITQSNALTLFIFECCKIIIKIVLRGDNTLKFVVSLTHTPENCLSRKENIAEGKKWVKNMRKSADKLGVKIEGAYVTPNEHTMYFILECNGLKELSEFLGPPILSLHSAKVSPVISLEETFGLGFMKIATPT